jgi:hypothetical protein
MTVSAVASLADPFGLGTDIALLGDLNPVWGLVSGFTNLGYALARRLNAVLGSLFYDLGYGFCIPDMIHQALDPADISAAQQAIAGQCLLDERVQTCAAALTLDESTGTLTINITGTIAQGVPFTFILAATGVTVALLSVNGVPVSPAAAASQNATPAPAGTTIIIQGGSSEPGPPGPPGPGGSAQLTFNLNPNGYGKDSGVEEVVDQIETNLGALAASVTFELVAAVLSQSGTATFRLRLGGSDGVADGTIVATITATTGAFVLKNNSLTIANPTGLQRLKVTIQSSAAGQDAQIDRGASLTIR